MIEALAEATAGGGDSGRMKLCSLRGFTTTQLIEITLPVPEDRFSCCVKSPLNRSPRNNLMIRLAGVCLFAFLGAFCNFASGVEAASTALPEDGQFHLERGKPRHVVGVLVETFSHENWRSLPRLEFLAPELPDLPRQEVVATRLHATGREENGTETFSESGPDKRRFVRLEFARDWLDPRSPTEVILEYEAKLYPQTLRAGPPPRPVPDLTPEEKRRYLRASHTMDFDDRKFRRWVVQTGLRKEEQEGVFAFGHRAFRYLVDHCRSGGNTEGYDSRRPSVVSQTLASDCGGLSLLFVAVMRANGVPARSLFGRWANTQTDDYGQFHVVSEFFVPSSGWVPVEVINSIGSKPEDSDAFFGNDGGGFITFHLDTDLEPVPGYRHAWAQYILPRWQRNADLREGFNCSGGVWRIREVATAD